jgi:hypothetical protein
MNLFSEYNSLRLSLFGILKQNNRALICLFHIFLSEDSELVYNFTLSQPTRACQSQDLSVVLSPIA